MCALFALRKTNIKPNFDMPGPFLGKACQLASALVGLLLLPIRGLGSLYQPSIV